MQFNALVCLAFLAGVSSLPAAAWAQSWQWGTGAYVDVQLSNAISYNEIAPEFVKGGLYNIFVTYSMTFSCLSTTNPYFTPVTLSTANCTPASTSYALRHAEAPSFGFDPSDVPEATARNAGAWRLNYNGVFSVRLLVLKGSGQPLQIGITHGENKNAFAQPVDVPGLPGACWNGTLLPPQAQSAFPCDACADESSDACVYSAFVNLVKMVPDVAHSYGWSMFDQLDGPIAWPVAGYTTSLDGSVARRQGSGLRHPRALIDSDFLYVFYIEDEYGAGYSRAGVKVVRASIAGSTLSPSDFRGWCGTTQTWTPSLPAGLTPTNIEQHMATPGGCTTAVIEFSPVIAATRGFAIQFVAARDVGGGNGGNGWNYVGIEEYFIFRAAPQENCWGLRLWLADNVTWWDRPHVVYEKCGVGGSINDLSDSRYPVLLSFDGESHDVVNSTEGFWVAGAYHLGGIPLGGRPPLRRRLITASMIPSSSAATTGVDISTTGTATTGVATTTTGVAVVATTGTTTDKSGSITSGAPRAEFAARWQWWVSIMSMVGAAALCR
jgi:hypothetical protein